MCRRLLDSGCPGIHLYSLNLEKTVLGILERMGMVDSGNMPRSLPWRQVPAGRAGRRHGGDRGRMLGQWG